jgi:hypothetical protein
MRYLIARSVMSSGVVIPVAVDHVGMETVLISNILDCPDVATGLL